MKESEIYQQHLAESVAQVINWQGGVTEYLTRLAEMKAKRIWQSNVGKVFKSEELKEDVMVVAVGFKIHDDIWKSNSSWKEYAIIVKIAFVKDVNPILQNKRKKITDKERKYLKRLQEMREMVIDQTYTKYHNYSRYYSTSKLYDEVKGIQDDIEYLKNNIKAVDTAEWSWSLEDILAQDFLTKGINYDNQTLFCKDKKDYEY